MRHFFKKLFKSKPATNPIPAEVSGKFLQAQALHQSGRLTQAQIIYEDILRTQPEHSDALHLLGLVAAQTNNMQRAKELIGKAISIKPNNAALHLNYGNVLKELKQFNTALTSYLYAIKLKPDYADAYSNCGNVLKDIGQLDAALASYNKAIELNPDCALFYSNRGVAFQQLKQFDAALASYDKAIMLQADYAEALYNKSLLLLLKGDFDKGWGLYEWRWKSSVNEILDRRSFPQEIWLGNKPLVGKSILLYCDQGMGDTLQFCRYAKLVAGLGARVILEVQKPLAELLANVEGVAQIVIRGESLPYFDYQCPLSSLPLAFKTNLQSIPSPTKYLNSDSSKVAQWQARLGVKTKPRVGLVWSGNIDHQNDHNRSLPLSYLLKYLPSNFQYISLQKEVRENDRQTLQSNSDILNFADSLHDFSDTAVLCELMDVVISVDTSVAHLSAALGNPTWILLPFIPDWRWLLDRADSPWYASAKLYRQEELNDWNGALRQVNADLINLAP